MVTLMPANLGVKERVPLKGTRNKKLITVTLLQMDKTSSRKSERNVGHNIVETIVMHDRFVKAVSAHDHMQYEFLPSLTLNLEKI